MAKTLYVFSSSTLKRKDNNLILQVKDRSVQYLPVEGYVIVRRKDFSHNSTIILRASY